MSNPQLLEFQEDKEVNYDYIDNNEPSIGKYLSEIRKSEQIKEINTGAKQIRDEIAKEVKIAKEKEKAIRKAASDNDQPFSEKEQYGNTANEIKKLIDINLFGVFNITKAVLSKMSGSQSGSIVNIGSISSERAIPRVHLAAYSATKAALSMFSKSIAVEYARRNIRCNCVNPGIINSGMIKPYLDDPQARKVLEERLPLNRVGEPEDVANAVLFYASDESSWITGTILNVDGGKSASEG